MPRAATQLRDLWAEHIHHEESQFSADRLSALLDPREEARLARSIGNHSARLQMKTVPPSLLVGPVPPGQPHRQGQGSDVAFGPLDRDPRAGARFLEKQVESNVPVPDMNEKVDTVPWTSASTISKMSNIQGRY